MKNLIGIPILALVLVLPAGLAFADKGDGNNEQKSVLQASIAPRLEVDSNLKIEDQSEGTTSENDMSSSGLHFEGNPSMNGQKNGLLDHFGTTTPAGFMHEHATSTEMSSSTNSDNKGGRHETSFSIKSFWNWILGLPATTTIGDIRSQITASTTASSTIQTQANEGFFARLLNFLGFGK